MVPEATVAAHVIRISFPTQDSTTFVDFALLIFTSGKGIGNGFDIKVETDIKKENL